MSLLPSFGISLVSRKNERRRCKQNSIPSRDSILFNKNETLQTGKHSNFYDAAYTR